MSHPRHVIPGVPVHITQRGVNRRATFLSDDDFAYYLWILQAANVAAACAVHAYVLMTNHVHLLVTPADADGAARLMQLVGIRYVRYFNFRYRRTGTLWEGRFRSTVVDTDKYFLACSRYIERNPQRAGLTDEPAAYPWSSFRCNGCAERDQIITAHPLYVALGPDPVSRARAYARVFTEPSPSTAAVIRTAPLGRRTLPEPDHRQARAAVSASSAEREDARREGASRRHRPVGGRRALDPAP